MLPNKVIYEWCLETIEDGDDVVNLDFQDTPFKEIGENQVLCLIREEIGVYGLELRLWAYVKDNRLPDFFEDAAGQITGYKVPQKFKAIKL